MDDNNLDHYINQLKDYKNIKKLYIFYFVTIDKKT